MQDLWTYLKETQKPIVLYGMGNGADKIIAVLENKGISFKGVFASDGFVRQKQFHNFPVESYRDLKERFGDMIVLLCFGTHLPEVIESIKKISNEQELYAPEVPVIGGGLFDGEFYTQNFSRFERVKELLADEKSVSTLQNIINYKLSGSIDYLFDCEASPDEPYLNILKKTGGERILDLGAYNGDTALEFAVRFPSYQSIIAVEPDQKSFNKLIKNTAHLDNVTCLNLCASDICGRGGFSMKGGRSSAVGKGGEIEFSTVDAILNGENATLIKMDVEGEEKKVILGAGETILRYKPKMIISAYHRTEDLFDIPETVLKIRNDYKIYMRHFPSLPAWDTVYYFI